MASNLLSPSIKKRISLKKSVCVMSKQTAIFGLILVILHPVIVWVLKAIFPAVAQSEMHFARRSAMYHDILYFFEFLNIILIFNAALYILPLLICALWYRREWQIPVQLAGLSLLYIVIAVFILSMLPNNHASTL